MKKIYLITTLITGFAFITHVRASNEFYPQNFADFQKKFGDTIPYPPEKLTDALLKLDDESTINAAIFPHGRSLERDATDFLFPRTVISWKSSQSSTPFYLFIGYTPNKSQLEIISWNWNTRQFDFGVVSDYAANKKPKFISANKLGCISCHQSRIPIFPVIPWSETTFKSNITNRLKAETKDSFVRYLFQQQDRQKISSPVVDFNNAKASALAQMQGFCQNACGGDLWCRRQILETALVEIRQPSSSIEHFSAQELNKRIQAMKQNWPSDLFSFMSEKILDRIPGTNEKEISIDQDPMRTRKIANNIQPEMVNDEKFLTRYRDCWNFDKKQTAMIEDLSDNEIKSAMQTEQMNHLVREWLPSENNIILALSSALKEPQKITSPEEVKWDAPVKLPRIISDPTRPTKPTKDLFKQYCMGCHREGSLASAPVLPLENLDLLKTYVGTAKRTVRETIEPNNQLMPPLFAPQPTKEELEQMYMELNL